MRRRNATSGARKFIATTDHIAIAGAGIGGLAAARALALRGFHVSIFEQSGKLAEVGAGLQISPNGVRVLKALGLKETAAKLASSPEFLQMRDHRGGSVARLPLYHCEARYGEPFWQMHRADLLSVLSQDLPPGVDLRLGEQIQSCTDAGSGVQIETSAGVVHADALIGADGVRSKLREQVCGVGAPQFTGQAAWRALLPADRAPALFRVQETQLFMGPGRHLVAYPLRNGDIVNIVAVREHASWQAEGWSEPGNPAELRGYFGGFGNEAKALLAEIDDCIYWGLFGHRELPSWSRGRTALLGDACHPMLPYLAQGAVMALEDAWVLARQISEHGIKNGLGAYERLRKPRTSRVQAAARFNAWAYHLRLPGFRHAAHLGLKGASTFAPERLLARFDWIWGEDVVSHVA